MLAEQPCPVSLVTHVPTSIAGPVYKLIPVNRVPRWLLPAVLVLLVLLVVIGALIH
jgi:hypothetical protein